MSLLDLFLLRKNSTANIAKNRLQVILKQQQSDMEYGSHYLPQLKCDLIKIIYKYMQVYPKKTSICLEKKDNNTSLLKLKCILIKK